jgi:hypothetical protein
MNFENTLTRDEEDTLRQWIGTHTWGFTIGALHYLADGGGKTSSDPCRLYFEKRNYYYAQVMESYAAPTPDHYTPEALRAEPRHPEEGEGPES